MCVVRISSQQHFTYMIFQRKLNVAYKLKHSQNRGSHCQKPNRSGDFWKVHFSFSIRKHTFRFLASVLLTVYPRNKYHHLKGLLKFDTIFVQVQKCMTEPAIVSVFKEKARRLLKYVPTHTFSRKSSSQNKVRSFYNCTSN